VGGERELRGRGLVRERGLVKGRKREETQGKKSREMPEPKANRNS
jgi:hypothetical protein